MLYAEHWERTQARVSEVCPDDSHLLFAKSSVFGLTLGQVCQGLGICLFLLQMVELIYTLKFTFYLFLHR